MIVRWALPLGLAILLVGAAAAQTAAPDESGGAACIKQQLQLADAALLRAGQSYEKSEYEAAHKNLDELTAAAQQATSCALATPRMHKRAEIALRTLLHRMNALARTQEAEEQPRLNHAIREVDLQHDRLLRAIFGAAAGKEKPQ